jgi:hypothetical protein
VLPSDEEKRNQRDDGQRKYWAQHQHRDDGEAGCQAHAKDGGKKIGAEIGNLLDRFLKHWGAGSWHAESAVSGHATNGAVGFDDLKWLVPVRPGDVLSVENVVVEKVESRSRRDIGVVKIAGRVLNQTGEAVMSLTSLVLYRRRPGA